MTDEKPWNTCETEGCGRKSIYRTGRICAACRYRARLAANPEKEKALGAIRVARWRSKHPEQARAVRSNSIKKMRKEHPDKVRARASKQMALWRECKKLGLTPSEFRSLLADEPPKDE